MAEHDGRRVRFLPRFLGFAREYGFFPHACNPASGWEKGKSRTRHRLSPQNFWPLREFTDLHDVNRQARQWLAEVADQRVHRETRGCTLERFQPEALRPLPIIPNDYRDSAEALVHKDLRLPFDGNRYCVPHRYVGRRLTVKADSSAVVIYDRAEEVVSYARSWRRGQTFGAPATSKPAEMLLFYSGANKLAAKNVTRGLKERVAGVYSTVLSNPKWKSRFHLPQKAE